MAKPQHWPTRVGHTATLTDSSWSNLNIDRLELFKPQHWPSRVGQTSTLTDSSWSNLNIDRLELVIPQHWPTRVGQTSTSTDASWSNLLLPPPPPPNHVPLEPSLDKYEPSYKWWWEDHLQLSSSGSEPSSWQDSIMAATFLYLTRFPLKPSLPCSNLPLFLPWAICATIHLSHRGSLVQGGGGKEEGLWHGRDQGHQGIVLPVALDIRVLHLERHTIGHLIVPRNWDGQPAIVPLLNYMSLQRIEPDGLWNASQEGSPAGPTLPAAACLDSDCSDLPSPIVYQPREYQEEKDNHLRQTSSRTSATGRGKRRSPSFGTSPRCEILPRPFASSYGSPFPSVEEERRCSDSDGSPSPSSVDKEREVLE